jgi:hypothetical protein
MSDEGVREGRREGRREERRGGGREGRREGRRREVEYYSYDPLLLRGLVVKVWREGGGRREEAQNLCTLLSLSCSSSFFAFSSSSENSRNSVFSSSKACLIANNE